MKKVCHFHIFITSYDFMMISALILTISFNCSMCFGHILEVGGAVSKIDWTDLKLSDFDKGDSVPMNYKITFKGLYLHL